MKDLRVTEIEWRIAAYIEEDIGVLNSYIKAVLPCCFCSAQTSVVSFVFRIMKPLFYN